MLLTDGSATRLPDVASHSPSAIDLSLATSEIASDMNWEVGDDPLASDHLPITISFHPGAVREPPAHTPQFRYDKADWPRFRSVLDLHQISNANDLSIEDLNKIISKNILSAAEQAIPISRPGGTRTRNNPWWTPECDAAVREKRKACRLYRRYSTPATHADMIKKKSTSNRLIAQAKKQYWLNYTETLNGQTKLGEIYKKIKKIKQQYVQPDPVMSSGDRHLITNAEKAEAFATTFAAASSIETLPEKTRLLRETRETEGPLVDPPSDNTSPINSDISKAELQRALSKIKKVKVAVGADRVSYGMLRELPPTYVDLLLALYRRCWEEGVIPAGWKHAIVTPVPKPGKPRNQPSSYRPISLTSHMGKIYESILKSRLEHHCERSGVLPRCQAGFRKGRGVSDHLVKLGSHVRKALARHKLLFAFFFDIKRAYDTVWHRRLLEKIQKLGLSGRIYNFIKTFLQNRTFLVRWRGTESTSRGLQMGVPQGSVIAPLLFNLILHDTHKIKLEQGTITLFADDLAAWQETKFRRHGKPGAMQQWVPQAQRVVDRVNEYATDCGFALSAEKTQFLLFSRAKLIPSCSVKLNDTPIHPIKAGKYLGVYFTKNNSATTHIKYNISRARKAINLIKMLRGTPWADSPKSLVQLTNSLVRSRLTYGLEAYWDLKPSLVGLMESTECLALKLAMGLPRCTPTRLVYRDSGLLPLKQHLNLICAKYLFRAQQVPNSTENEITEC